MKDKNQMVARRSNLEVKKKIMKITASIFRA